MANTYGMAGFSHMDWLMMEWSDTMDRTNTMEGLMHMDSQCYWGADTYGKAKSGGANMMDLMDTNGKAGQCGRI